MSLYTYSSLLTPYVDKVGATLTQAGLIVGSYGFTQMILRFPLGILSDYLEKKKIFVSLGMLFALVSSIGLMLTQNVWLILFFRGLAGVAASFWVQITSLYINYSSDNTIAISQLNFVNNLGLIIGIFLGGQIISQWSYKIGFAFGAIFAGTGLLLSFFLPSDKPLQVEKRKFENGQNIIKKRLGFIDKDLIWGSVFGALSQYLTFSTSQGFVPQYAAILGASTSEVSMMNTINAVARVVAIALVGKVLLNIFNSKHILIVSMFIYTLAILMIPFVINYYLLYIIMFLLGMCSGTQMTYFMDAATSHINPAYRSSAMGFYQAMYGVGMVVGPSITGLVADISSIPISFISVSLVGLFAAILMVIKLPDRTQNI